MRFRSMATALSLAVFFAAQEPPSRPESSPPASAPPATHSTQTHPPVSLDRIREALERPTSLLTLPDPKADFHVDVVDRQRIVNLLAPIDFGSAPDLPQLPQPPSLHGGPPGPSATGGGSVDPGQILHGIRHYFAERAAREEFQRVFREFCATHDCAPPGSRPIPANATATPPPSSPR